MEDRLFSFPGTVISKLRLAGTVALVGLALTAQATQGQVAEVTRQGRSLSQTLDAMNVERRWLPGGEVDWKTGSPRETPITEGRYTYSSAFVSAACARLGVELPRLADPPAANAANDLCDWLRAEGPAHGWKAVKGPLEAQARANEGEVVIASFKEADPARDGHIAIVRPSTRSERAVREEGPQVIQAGLANFRNTSLKNGFHPFAGAWPGRVRFYAHDRPEPPHLPKGVIDARQAVRIAERFVRQNGYTDFVPDDLRRLLPETLEFSSKPSTWLKQRHNTLTPLAVGYRKGARNERDGWTVGFALVDPINGDPEIGMGVTMDARGRNVTMQHMGFFLKGLEPRPE
jgi:hypothetical protein